MNADREISSGTQTVNYLLPLLFLIGRWGRKRSTIVDGGRSSWRQAASGRRGPVVSIVGRPDRGVSVVGRWDGSQLHVSSSGRRLLVFFKQENIPEENKAEKNLRMSLVLSTVSKDRKVKNKYSQDSIQLRTMMAVKRAVEMTAAWTDL